MTIGCANGPSRRSVSGMTAKSSPRRIAVASLVVAIGVSLSCNTQPADSARTPGTDTSVIRYGPFAVAPETGRMSHSHGHGAGGLRDVLLDVPKPCDGCWITGFRPTLATPDGTALDPSADVMLHHFVLADGFPSCGTVARPDPRFFAAGAELSAGTLPRGYGYHVDDGDRWGAVVELMNSGSAMRLVYVDVAFEHTVDPQRDVVPLWFDIGGCGSSAYSVPAHRSVRERTYRLGIGGEVVAAVGHLHVGGVVVSAVDETTDRVICASRAMGSPRLRQMSICRGDPLTVVDRGDRVRITSVYDARHPETDVMGIMVAYVSSRGQADSTVAG
jgi:Stress up-regulated Nod 19